MITFIIGHRGVGKSAFAKKLALSEATEVVDLDEKIEATIGDSIAHFFAQQGEMRFRLLEQTTLQSVLAHVQKPTVIALGAGFSGELPQKSRVVWLRRSTDGDGRVFLNRPRLEPAVGPLQESLNRFAAREQRYRQLATDVLQIPEGYTSGLENYFLPESRMSLNADLTLYSPQLNREFIQRRRNWGVRRFELRTDILSSQELDLAYQFLAPEEVILSVRKAGALNAGKSAFVDWPLELGAPTGDVNIVSLHQRSGTFASTCDELSLYQDGRVLKLAVEVKDFEELWQGHQWWLQNPTQRAFLPNSLDGRWQWYRSLFGPRMPIHYIREDEGSSLDQPLLWQSVLQTPLQSSAGFAAVLGSPIYHSRTPMEHREFFAAHQIPVVAIRVEESEWNQALVVLKNLGLQFAAVTSPLKKLAKEISNSDSQLTSINTLVLKNGEWQGTNTDVDGLRELKNLAEGPVALWGGGGTLESVKSIFNDAQEFSARTGLPRSNTNVPAQEPETVIWAVGRNREFKWPPSHWPLKKVIDLNYSDNSPGLELAAIRGLAYQSGLEMFWAQAKAQRIYWQRYL